MMDALFTIRPFDEAAYVARYDVVQVSDAPGTSVPSKPPHCSGVSPSSGSATITLVKVTLPVFVPTNVYVTVVPVETVIADTDLVNDSAGFCRDECLAISLVAACQHDAGPALKSCAFALLGSSNLGRALVATEVVARTLSGAGCLLQAHGIVETVSFAAPFHGARSGRVH